MEEYKKMTREKRRNLTAKHNKLRPKKITPRVKYSRKSKHPNHP